MEHKFKINDDVVYNSGEVINYQTKISALIHLIGGVQEEVDENGEKNGNFLFVYYIEFNDGWEPTEKQIEKYDLDPSKKYFITKESELTKI